MHEELGRFDKIIKENASPASIDITLAKEGHSEHLHQAEIHAMLPLGEFHVKESNPDLHVAATRAIEKLLHRVREEKGRIIDHRDRPDENNDPLRKKKEDFEE